MCVMPCMSHWFFFKFCIITVVGDDYLPLNLSDFNATNTTNETMGLRPLSSTHTQSCFNITIPARSDTGVDDRLFSIKVVATDPSKIVLLASGNGTVTITSKSQVHLGGLSLSHSHTHTHTHTLTHTHTHTHTLPHSHTHTHTLQLLMRF